mgnify:CR=1 FL=1
MAVGQPRLSLCLYASTYLQAPGVYLPGILLLGVGPDLNHSPLTGFPKTPGPFQGPDTTADLDSRSPDRSIFGARPRQPAGGEDPPTT